MPACSEFDRQTPSPADTAAFAVAVGRLGAPGAAECGRVIQAAVGSGSSLGSYTVGQLADVLWGLAKAKQAVQPEWAEAVWTAAAERAQPVRAG